MTLRTIDCRIGQHRTEQLLTELVRNRAKGQEIPAERWARLHELHERWRHNADGFNRAEADLFTVYIAEREGRTGEVLPGIQAFFSQYYEPKKDRMFDPEYKDLFAGAHTVAGYACIKLGRPNDAMVHFKAVVDMAATSPPLLREKVYLPSARYQLCRLLHDTGAPISELDQAINAFKSDFPKDRRVRSLEKLRGGE